MLRPATLVLALALVAPASAQTAAADPLMPAVGTRVRVFTSSDTPVIGTLVRTTNDSLVVAPERGGGALALSRTAVGSFEMSRGRPSRIRAAAPWAVTGALLFGFSLMMAGEAVCTPDMTDAQCTDESNRAIVGRAAGGAMFGAALGAAFGMKFRRGERWRAATLPVRVSLMLPSQDAGRAAGVAVAVRW